MKEKIYTIPVTEAFQQDCECPLCLMEEKLEEEALEYTLGASMMEPDSRIETNKNGFCQKHFTKLNNLQKNRLSLALIIDTHLIEQNARLSKAYENNSSLIAKECDLSLGDGLVNKLKRKKTATQEFLAEIVQVLDELEHSCTICNKINFTMDKFIDVILYLYFKEPEFFRLFNSKKGVCIKHLKLLLLGCQKYLDTKNQAIFIRNLMSQQVTNMQRIQEDVNWFTKKFDYRFKDEPWKNSKDAIQRSIKKLVGPADLQ